MRDFIYRWWVCREGGWDGGRGKRGTGAGGRGFGRVGGVGGVLKYLILFFFVRFFRWFFVNLCVMVLNLLLFIKNWTAIMGRGGFDLFFFFFVAFSC